MVYTYDGFEIRAELVYKSDLFRVDLIDPQGRLRASRLYARRSGECVSDLLDDLWPQLQKLIEEHPALGLRFPRQ